jgi:uncharacterized protein YgbK (DUF1537 family)
MPENRTLVLADDLTGANDTVIQFVIQGFPSLVFTDSAGANAGFFKSHRVLAVNSNSRGMNPEDAYHVVRKIAEQFKGECLVYKKIDSCLRGNPGRELAAVMDALAIPLALVAPSFPANRSVLENGMLYSGATTDSDSTSGIDAVRIFADGTGRKTESIPLEVIRRGAVGEFIMTHNREGTQVFVADAVSDEDLETICKASASLDLSRVLAGSAGLANQLARQIGAVREEKILPRRDTEFDALSPVLMIAGTRQSETAAQINRLSDVFNVPIVKFKTSLIATGEIEQAVDLAYADVSEQMKRGIKRCRRPPLCIIAVESMFGSSGDNTDTAISGALGILAKKIVESFWFPTILCTGGDTSLAVCQQLGISTMEPLAEILPGIPLGRITGSAYDGRFIVTKSGRFGNPDSLVEIMKAVHKVTDFVDRHYLGVTQ